MKTLTKTTILAAFIIIIIFTSCKKDESTLPAITTDSVLNVGPNSAQCKATITSTGGTSITFYGLCWSANTNPTINDNKVNIQSVSGTAIPFTQTAINLTPGTKYFIKAYATNKVGTAYGKEFNFTTTSDKVTDNEGTIYKIVSIGSQVWFAENLKTRHYNNGDTIPSTYPANKDISTETEPKYQWVYNGDTTYLKTYGRLYTWYVVSDSRGVCPVGWHVPTYAEWNTLAGFVGGYNKLKEQGTTHWQAPNTGADNSSGFNVLPDGGFADGEFVGMGLNADFWAKDTIPKGTYIWMTTYGDAYNNTPHPDYGLNIRCIKN